MSETNPTVETRCPKCLTDVELVAVDGKPAGTCPSCGTALARVELERVVANLGRARAAKRPWRIEVIEELIAGGESYRAVARASTLALRRRALMSPRAYGAVFLGIFIAIVLSFALAADTVLLPAAAVTALLVALWSFRSDGKRAYVLRLTPDAVTVTRLKSPHVVVARETIRQLTTRSTWVSQWQTVYAINAIDDQNRLIPILDGISQWSEANFIEVFLKERLGIADEYVPGEAGQLAFLRYEDRIPPQKKRLEY